MTTNNAFRGTSRRAAIRRALPHHWYDRARAIASLRQLADGSWVATRIIPWAAVATIPMPTRQPDMVIEIGFRGREREEASR